ncbi:MAG: hypothetical protein NZ805_14815 [Armatimonadetes bacterium]|nr:hypothetical protein [Armatimonadota bacterium]MDW8028895.1 hypothetical protein [Armatimonadota bacterium]
MERLIGELFAQCVNNPSFGGAFMWVTFVTVVVWAPYLLPQRLQGLAMHMFGYGMLGVFAERLLQLSTSLFVSVPLLELTALGLTAVVVWIEAIKRKREKTEKLADWQKEQYRDWTTAARLALWSTLTIMPMVRWI